MGRTELVRWPFLVAPAGFLGGWLLLKVVDGDTVPGLWWTLAHTAWVLGFVAFAAVGVQMRALARPGVVGALLAWGVVVGAVLNVVQDAVDLVLGAVAATPTDLSARLDAVAGLPGVSPVLYDVGPNVLWVALALLAVLLARRGVIHRWAAGATVLGVVLLGVALVVGRGQPVTAVGALALGIGLTGTTLVPTARRVPEAVDRVG